MDRQLFRETFSSLHASEDTITEVMKMAREQEKTTKKNKHPLRTGLLIGLAAVLLVGSAFAAAESGFFDSIFGTKGQEDTVPHEVLEEGKGTTYTMPGREWAEVDEAQAAALVGEHVGTVGASISVGNWTLTVDEYLIDDHGVGAITYTLANPNGIGEAIHDAGNGEYYVNSPDGLREIGLTGVMQDGETLGFDTRNIVDNTLTTDTELHAVMYFAPFHRFEEGEAIQMSLFRVLEEPDSASGEDAPYEEQILTFTPESFTPTVELTSPEGYSAHVSPIGLFFDVCFEGIDSLATTDTLTVQFADGTEYVLESEDPFILNRVLDCESFEENIEACVFNRLVDTEGIVSVTRTGTDGSEFIFTPEA